MDSNGQTEKRLVSDCVTSKNGIFLLTDTPSSSLIDDYVTAIDGVLELLVRTTPNEKHVYIGELINGKDFKPKMDHLTCFLPGTLLLGYMNGMPHKHLQLAQGLMETCFQTYMKQPTQLAPEITYFNLKDESESDIYVKSNDAHNILRPEFIESLYYFYALTGNTTYQEMGWTIFNAFVIFFFQNKINHAIGTNRKFKTNNIFNVFRRNTPKWKMATLQSAT